MKDLFVQIREPQVVVSEVRMQLEKYLVRKRKKTYMVGMAQDLPLLLDRRKRGNGWRRKQSR